MKLELHVHDNKCFICGCTKKKADQLHEKSTTKVAKTMFEATCHLQDEVFERTAHLISIESFIAARLMYPKSCLLNYQYKYNVLLSNTKTFCDTNVNEFHDIKSDNSSQFIIDAVKSIENKFLLGKIFSLKDISIIIQEKYAINVKSSNIKSCLTDYFGSNVKFVLPADPKKSILFYCNNID